MSLDTRTNIEDALTCDGIDQVGELQTCPVDELIAVSVGHVVVICRIRRPGAGFAGVEVFISHDPLLFRW